MSPLVVEQELERERERQESSAKLTNQRVAMHSPLARLVSMPVIVCLHPSSSIVILVFYLFSSGISE